MKVKDKFNLLFFVFLIFVVSLILTACIITLEAESEPNQTNISEERQEVVIEFNLSEEELVIVPVEEQEEQEQVEEEKEEQEKQAEEQAPVRTSEVEFYFLLKGKSYFKHILKEQEKRTYNMSGYWASIEPIIITRNEAKFKINDFVTKPLEEKESDATPEFEIIVKDIYYRS